MDKEEKYYLWYEDRYQRVHGQGFKTWNPVPDMSAKTLEEIDRFLDYSGYSSSASVIEFGCGEGFIAEHLMNKGFRYVGVDISESALKSARERMGITGNDVFMQLDIVTDLDRFDERSFDLVIDNQCLHMLVLDNDRNGYLSQVKRLLKEEGKAFFQCSFREEIVHQEVTDFTDWLEKTGDDYTELHDYDAYTDGKRYTIQLPRVPARANNEAGYHKELEQAGLCVEHFVSNEWQCLFYAAVR